MPKNKNSKNASRHVEQNKLIWCLPEDYRNIILLKEGMLEVEDFYVPYHIVKEYDKFCNSLGI